MPHSDPRGTLLARSTGVLVIAAVVVTLQIRSGAYQAELSTPDESPHFITALMIRDYVVSGLHRSPWAFAVDYYVHYPKVAFGSWPPFFHVLQALWLLALPVTKSSVLWLLAAIVIAVAAMVFETARRRWGTLVALAFAVLLAAAPTSQFLVSRVLADGLVALFDLLAAWYWLQYLSRQQTRDAVLFGAMAGFSMLAKQNGAVLLTLPFLTIPLTAQWTLVRQRAFWAGPALGAAIGAPFILYSARIFIGSDPSGSTWTHFTQYCRLLVGELGLAVGPLGLVGAGLLAVRRVARPLDPFWATVVALPVALVVFHALTPNVPSSRYLYAAFPALLLLSGLAVEDLLRRARGDMARSAAAVMLAATVVSGATLPAAIPKPHIGFDRVATRLGDRADCTTCVILASSRAEREGLLIVEVALRDKRPQHIVLRANKLLSQSNWIGEDYQLRYADAESVYKVLMDIPVKFVVIDDAEVGALPHHELLKQALTAHQETWVRIFADDPGIPTDIAVYENATAADFNGRIDVGLANPLGGSIGTGVQ